MYRKSSIVSFIIGLIFIAELLIFWLSNYVTLHLEVLLIPFVFVAIFPLTGVIISVVGIFLGYKGLFVHDRFSLWGITLNVIFLVIMLIYIWHFKCFTVCLGPSDLFHFLP